VKTGQRRSDAAFYLGLLAEKQAKPAEAIGWYRQVNLGDFALRAQLRVAELLSRQGDTEEALNHLRDIRSNNAQLAPELLQAEADVLVAAGRADEALAIHDARVRANPNDADVLYARSLVREKLGNVKGAIRDLRAILKFAPDNGSALNALGYMLSNHSERYKEALRYVERALEQTPDQPAIIDSYGWILFKQGRLPEAAAALQRAYDLFPDPEIAAHLGEVLWVAGEQVEAREIWQAALKLEAKLGSEPNDVLQDTLQRFAPELAQ